MSFLNPVNEPVLRFSSTDAGAPQINYNSRVAGDVKAVLKACLVTGYGDKASAGWSIVNEANHVAEFVSPSAAMSDYRLGIDDTSTSTTTWYYQYQDVRNNMRLNSPTKNYTNVNKTHAENGWQLLVTARGLLLLEMLWHSAVDKLSCRVTYFGAIKSALPEDASVNICFFNAGHNAAIEFAQYFYNGNTYVYTKISSYENTYFSAATSNILSTTGMVRDVSAVDLVSQIFIAASGKNLLIGALPPLLSKTTNKSSDSYGIAKYQQGGRSVMGVTAGYSHGVKQSAINSSYDFLIPLDYWEC